MLREMNRVSLFCILLVLSISMGCASVTSKESKADSSGTKVFVVRHAEAYQNLSLQSRPPGQKQDSLTMEGFKQAERAGKYLKDRNIAVVVASPTGRTTQTARIIAEEVGLNGVFSENPAFKSMKKGKTPDGKTVSWSWRKDQWAAGHDPRPQGGESLEDAINRAVPEVEVLIRKYPGRGVVIVTHSDICAGLAGQVTGTSFHERYKKYGIGLGSIVEIVVDQEGTWKSPAR